MLSGIDISSWQATTPDLTGLSFVIVRAGYATTVDPTYTTHAADVRHAGLVLGAYWYWYDGQDNAQAVQAFLRLAGDADFLVLDFEGTNSNTDAGRAQAADFIDRLHAVGRKVGLYHSLSGFPSVGQDWGWIAYWSSSAPTIPWQFWQYTDSPLDRDYFAGDATDLAAFVASQEGPVLFTNPVKGVIHVSGVYYPTAPGAWKRPSGNYDFAVTQDFGPTDVTSEPSVSFVNTGHEYDIYGKLIPSGSYSNFHRGIDLGNTRCGDPVLAAAAGKVTASGIDSTGANYIKIDHGKCPVCGHSFETWYWHLGKRIVSAGATVTAGQTIGYVGTTGISNACHLHFEVHRDGALVDPYGRLKQNTATDPDYITPPEAEMILTKYLPLYTADIASGYRVRKDATLSADTIRITSTVEHWSILGVVKGDLALGSDQWYVRVNGLAFEFIHSSAVSNVQAPAPTGISPTQEAADILKAEQAQYDLDAKSITVSIVPATATAKLTNARPV